MKKRIISVILAMMMVLSLAALTSCGDDGDSKGGLPIGGDTDGAEDGGKSVTAPDGTTVELPEAIASVITVSPAAKSIFETVGKSSVVTASYDPSEDKTSDIVSAKPDVVIYDEGAAIDASAITGAGIVAIKLPVADTMAAVKKHIKFIGDMMGVDTTSTVDSMTKSFTAMQSSTSEWVKLNVYIELGTSDSGYLTAAPYSYVYELVSSAGGNNIFGEASGKEGFITVTADEILALNPDVIFTVGSVDEITGREGWSDVKAVANGQVYAIENLNPSNDALAAAQAMNDFLKDIMYAD